MLDKRGATLDPITCVEIDELAASDRIHDQFVVPDLRDLGIVDVTADDAFVVAPIAVLGHVALVLLDVLRGLFHFPLEVQGEGPGL